MCAFLLQSPRSIRATAALNHQANPTDTSGKLFRHQLITYLTKQGIISPKLQLLSGHRMEQSLAVYRALALADVAEEYEAAMRVFPVR